MLSDRVWKNKMGAHHSVGSLRTLLRPLRRVFAGLVFNGYVMGSSDAVWLQKREWKRERFPSSSLALFMRAAGALMALIHEWKGERRGVQTRGVEHECTPRATPESTSQLIACTPLPFTTHGQFRVWDFAHLMMLWGFWCRVSLVGVKVAF